MPSDQTRSAILAAAERLYADRGFGDVTLRDIVAQANVNLAAVNYHFGSKDELIAELFVTRSIATNRERLKEHMANPTCMACHSLMDPVGLAFEKFDAIGMRREKHKLLFYPDLTGVAARWAKPKEIDLELDTKGWVAGIPDSEFTSPRELGEILAKSPQCQECLVKQVFRYMSGRQDTPADRPVLNEALEVFRKSDYRFKELMIALVDVLDAREHELSHLRRFAL